MTLALRYAVRSDVGLLREGNEDSAYASPRLLAVADGMGGHAAGEVASAVAIAAVAELDATPPSDDPLTAFKEAVAAASRTLHDMASANPAMAGMGTTLTAMLWAGRRYALCHIGDSRAYLLRDGELYQITHDHSLVQSLVDEGRISAAEAATHPQRSLILRALDGRGEAEPDLSMRESLPGDRYLLCSDGLSDVVADQTVRQTLSTVGDLDQVSVELVELAIQGGGPDNITVIVADVVDSDTAPPPASAPVLAGAASNGTGAGYAPADRADTSPGRARMLAHTGVIGPRSAIMVGDTRAGNTTWPEDVTWHGEATRPGDVAPSDNHAWSTAVPFAANGSPPVGDPTINPEPRLDGMDGSRRPRQEQRTSRRRWPIVTFALVVLAAAVIGGGYAAWAYTQRQYYVGASDGQVTIFRGINQRVAGINLSSVYQRTGIAVDAVPSEELPEIQETVSVPSLTDAQHIVSRIHQQYQQCKSAYAAQAAWQRQQQAAISSRSKKAKPLPAEPTVPAFCPPASAFGGTPSAAPASAAPSPRSSR